MARQDRAHRRVEKPDGRPGDGTPAEPGRRRAGGSRWARRRAARGAGLPARFVPALATALWPRRHHSRHARGEPDCNGLADDQVCIGDRYQIGEAEFEVTQPRVTCYRAGLRLGQPQMAALLVAHHRPGFYMRVIAEGRIQAGDAIIKTRTGPGALSVADTDALLYLPGPEQAKLQTAVRNPALSPGWQQSFRDMLARPAPPPAPAWPGFRELRVTQVTREDATVRSIYLAAIDGSPLPAARAGQYLTLRVPGAGTPAPVRSYSLSSAPEAGMYRISVKYEPHGAASGWLSQRLAAGELLEVAAPRGAFTLDDGAGPVLLAAAGIGVTPVLAMLHQLAAARSEREVWWLYAARSPAEHPFAAEAHQLLASLPQAREHIYYSAATADERHRARHRRAAHRRPADDDWHSYSRVRLHLRAAVLHDRHARCPHRARRHRREHPHRTIRGADGHQPRPDGPPHCDPAPAARASRKRAPGHLRPQRHHHRIRPPLAQRLRSAENRPRTRHVGAERHGGQGRDRLGLGCRQPGPRPDPSDLRTAATSAS